MMHISFFKEIGRLLSLFVLTNQAIDINTLRATSVAQIKARLAGNGPSLVKSRNTALSPACSPYPQIFNDRPSWVFARAGV
jgi:hypothetical protein